MACSVTATFMANLYFANFRNESLVVEEAAMQRLVSTVKSAHAVVDYGVPIVLMMFLGPLRSLQKFHRKFLRFEN